MIEVTLSVYVSESGQPDGGYYVAYCNDAMPPHQTDGPFPSVEDAKASVTVPVEWREPDPDECGPDVMLIGE